jgi:hypothetical protein
MLKCVRVRASSFGCVRPPLDLFLEKMCGDGKDLL